MSSIYPRILVPVDGSPTSEQGVDEAIALARQLGSRLRLLHVLDPRLLLVGAESPVSAQSMLDQQRADGSRLIEAAVARAREQGADAEGVLGQDPPQRVSDLILREAAQWPADLIVMGTHGRRGLSHLLLGSDAESVLRQARVPVLLVRACGDRGASS
jgi:nucleotide-binding universal stress UspA family protein